MTAALYISNGYDDSSQKCYEGDMLVSFLKSHPKVATWWATADVGDVMAGRNYFGGSTLLVKVTQRSAAVLNDIH